MGGYMLSTVSFSLKSSLSTHQREAVFKEIERLRRETPGIGFREVKTRLAERFQLLPSRETLKSYFEADKFPNSSVNRFEEVPSEELSFFLGAWLGDGWGDESDGGRRLLLKVRSKDFASEFGESATALLSKSKPYQPREIREQETSWYQVKVTSIALYGFVNRPFEELVPFIQPHPKAFLKGFFTAEGNPATSLPNTRGNRVLTLNVCVSCTARDYIEFARRLACELSFHPTSITCAGKKGTRTNLGVRNHTEWQFRITRLAEVERFLSTVGFADQTKQAKALRALSLIKELGPRRAAELWPELYVLRGRTWVDRAAAGTPTGSL